MDKTIRFAIYGCGMIANIHAMALKKTENAVLVGAGDIKTEQAKEFCKKYGIKFFGDFAEIISDSNIDAVCLCTPNGTHAELAIAALLANKNVVVEKPMATTTEDCDKIIAACGKSKAKLAVISQFRTADDVIKAKNILESGALGKLVLCDLYMKYYRSEDYFSNSWKGTKKLDGGGALMNQGIHGIDILQYIAGPIKEIKSFVRTLVHDIEVEDTAVAVVEFRSGAIGVIEAATSAYPGFDRRIEINGSKGSIVLKENKIETVIIEGKDCLSAVVEKSKTAGDSTKVDIEGHIKQFSNFVGTLNGKEKLILDENEGKKAVEIIERIYNVNSICE